MISEIHVKRLLTQEKLVSTFGSYLRDNDKDLAMKIIPYSVNISEKGDISLNFLGGKEYLSPAEESKAIELFANFYGRQAETH